jgi:hypothetical protein
VSIGALQPIDEPLSFPWEAIKNVLPYLCVIKQLRLSVQLNLCDVEQQRPYPFEVFIIGFFMGPANQM